MTNKLLFLTKNSLNRKIKTKWFLIANIILAFIIGAIINIDSIINLFGGDFNEKTKIYVIDNANSYDLLNENLKQVNKSISDSDSMSYELKKTKKSKDELTKNLKDKEILLIINEDKENTLDVSMISVGYIDTIDYQIIYGAINNTKTLIAINNSNIDPNTLNSIYKEVEIKRELLDETKKTEDENMEMIMTTVFPVIILPFFMLSLILIQLIGAEVNDEKSTRGMEIIISNVSPKTHFFSKVIAGNLFVIIQGILLILYCIIGFVIRKLIPTPSGGIETEIMNIINNISITNFVSKLIYIIPIVLFLMLLTFVAYSLVAGILASMTTNAEDFNQLQTPIIIISLVGYYLAMMAGVFKGALFIRILSYVPFISAILSPSLLVLGQIGIIDMLISIGIMIITIFILTKYGLKIYKVGILNYSSKDLWKKMFKAIKE